MQLATQYDPDLLCEEFITGEELTCPVLGEGATARALPVVRIAAPDGAYDYNHKYFTDDVKYHCPSGLPECGRKRNSSAGGGCLPRTSVVAVGGVPTSCYARAIAKPFLLEMNTSPGMTSHSLVPMSARAAGISYEDLCLTLLASATLDHPGGRAQP